MPKVTIAGHEYSAELSRAPDADCTAVSIYMDHVWAGNGHLDNTTLAITDCAADLGDDVYEALDEAIAADFSRGVGAEFDPTAR